jgi:hypothetical protein
MDEGGSRNGASLSEAAQYRGPLYWGPWVMNGKLWGWVSFFMEAQLGNLEVECL